MESIKIILPFPPSLNAAYANVQGVGRVKTKRYKEWLESCPALYDQHKGQCTISYRIYVPDKRKRDGNNLLKVVLDYLVSQKVIEEDNMDIVVGEQWIKGGLDKLHPRIEITIKEFKNEITIQATRN
jgi:Holliday junction resolvase RusA-like endonuclease